MRTVMVSPLNYAARLAADVVISRHPGSIRSALLWSVGKLFRGR